MADKPDQSPPSLWSRSKRSLGERGLTFLQHVPKGSKDDPQSSDKGESAKSGHGRRREQVRRAQRKHRERKETYIKSLEQQVLRLLNQQETAAEEKRAVEEQNAMLRGLLQQHGIPIPSEAGGFGPTARISMLDAPGGHPRLQVTMPETGPDYFAGFDIPRSPLPRGGSSSESIDVDLQAQASGAPSIPPSAFQARLTSESVQIHPPATSQATGSGKSLPPLPADPTRQPSPHPYGLDAPQIGIDFVLALENPCLLHTRSDLESTESYGHILTTQAPLLTNRPRPLESTSSWTIPAAEIERLLNLSSQLNLAGELTPVQAWSRIRSYPGFEKLNLDQLEILQKTLLREIQCYGFGAVMDETAFENILRQCFYGLQ